VKSGPILYISYDFPPILSPESIQSCRTAKYLFLRGWEPLVLASEKEPVFERIDPELSTLIPKGLEIYRSETFPFVCFIKMLHVYHALLGDPDRKRWWVKHALALALNLISEKKPHLMYSHANPLTCHMLALILKQRTDLPWVAHFSDPWVDNPYFRYRDPIRKRLNQGLEKMVFGNADAVIFTTEETRKIYSKKYPDQKFFVVPHSFDPDILNISPNQEERNSLQFVHAGSIYGLRTPAPLFQGLSSFLAQYPEVKSSLEFLFVGRFDRRFKPLIRQYGLDDVVKIKGTVPYLESLRMLRRADVLLLIEAASKRESIFLPSKLVDYIGIGKPIFAITPNRGPTARLIRNGGFFSADPLHPREIGEVLNVIWQRYQKGKLGEGGSDIQAAYNATKASDRLERIFEELLLA
jgi:glycosyltransferase involved in cell wall biosynthesis